MNKVNIEITSQGYKVHCNIKDHEFILSAHRDENGVLDVTRETYYDKFLATCTETDTYPPNDIFNHLSDLMDEVHDYYKYDTIADLLEAIEETPTTKLLCNTDTTQN